MTTCPLCTTNLEAHNNYFLNLLKGSKPLVSNVKEFGANFEKINFSEPFDQAFESCFISGIYWTLSSLIILNPHAKLVDIIKYDELIDIFNAVIACSQTLGSYALGFAPFYKNFYYSPTILHTLHAMQILVILSEDIGDYVTRWAATHSKMLINFLKLQILSNGSVSRTTYEGDIQSNNIQRNKLSSIKNSALCGDIRDVASLFGTVNLLHKLTGIDYSNEFANILPKTVEWIISCKNDDGGYGLRPGEESHIGACFCASAISKIKIIRDFTTDKEIAFCDTVSMCKWLKARQRTNGGISGHGDKAPDVCYSYWLLATLALTSNDGNGNCEINLDKLAKFINSCASPRGGFSKYPISQSGNGYFALLFDMENSPDPYHSFKSLVALSFIGRILSSLCIQHKLVSINPLTALIIHSNT
ncbi:Probable geranylgeranyl transferase type-2 subunit beta [Babesia microti strain RI]|uniref:Geranylgeranyl transferase type II subunit beta n=1 Tax=Babesia microti (strain RI) TaxID=1133968 RepID=I7IG05_BABMR|nr:Probable geranylgeranyl transferase type-2 subunit beta [Babesia microti strain RI]CCF73236.1 Probable geranylgeranyl transferase type-2 subunit beta [Babesia microti strain RI]|eukprot:XP_012647845.1 Probable geranylgeranyl transferase type-2 subunit beta [Babesia microti strain RI]